MNLSALRLQREWESSLCIYTIIKGCNVTKLDIFCNFVLFHISTVSRPRVNREKTVQAVSAGWDPAPDIPIRTCACWGVTGGVPELKRATIYPLGRKASRRRRRRKASGCITRFNVARNKKKPWICCRQQLSAWPLRFLTHTFILSLFYWTHVTGFALYCSCWGGGGGTTGINK